jgi:hypothetical protein
MSTAIVDQILTAGEATVAVTYSRVALCINGSWILIDNIRRNSTGLIAHVINGGWGLEIKGDVATCIGVESRKIETLVEIGIPTYVSSDYNEALAWAEDHMKNEASRNLPDAEIDY